MTLPMTFRIDVRADSIEELEAEARGQVFQVASLAGLNFVNLRLDNVHVADCRKMTEDTPLLKFCAEAVAEGA